MINAMRIIVEWMKAKNVDAELNLSGLGLTEFPFVPPTVKKLNIENNQISKIMILPPGLVSLKCANNKLKVYPNEGEEPKKYFMRLMMAK